MNRLFYKKLYYTFIEAVGLVHMAAIIYLTSDFIVKLLFVSHALAIGVHTHTQRPW